MKPTRVTLKAIHCAYALNIKFAAPFLVERYYATFGLSPVVCDVRAPYSRG